MIIVLKPIAAACLRLLSMADEEAPRRLSVSYSDVSLSYPNSGFETLGRPPKPAASLLPQTRPHSDDDPTAGDGPPVVVALTAFRTAGKTVARMMNFVTIATPQPRNTIFRVAGWSFVVGFFIYVGPGILLLLMGA